LMPLISINKRHVGLHVDYCITSRKWGGRRQSQSSISTF